MDPCHHGGVNEALENDGDPAWTPVQPGPIGILSDSHGRAERTERGIRILEQAGATSFLHLGDLGSQTVVDQLAGRPVRIVLGNVDPPDLADYASYLGVVVDSPTIRLLVGGRRLGATHGHLDAEVRQLSLDRPDYLVHGHTHRVRDDRIDGMRILNPGAIDRATRLTVGLLDPARDRFEILEIPFD